MLIVTIGGCFSFELFFAQPSLTGVMLGFVPSTEILKNPNMLYVSIGILGATVMPHNLYLHSSIVQTRNFERTPEGKREAIKFAHASIPASPSCSPFLSTPPSSYSRPPPFIGPDTRTWRKYRTPINCSAQLLGVGIASTLFAVALLASGQNSTLTGTLAGQIVMEGFLNFRITPWLRRLITRGIAIIPAVLIIGFYGENKTTELLVASQVVLSMQLGFAVWPLMRFTGEKAKMGEFANPLWIKVLGWTVATDHYRAQRETALRHLYARSGASSLLRLPWPACRINSRCINVFLFRLKTARPIRLFWITSNHSRR